MAAPNLQAIGTEAASVTTISPAWPAGAHAADDIGLLICECAGTQSISLTDAQGFVEVTGSPVTTGDLATGTTLAVFWCRATSGTMTAPTTNDPGNHISGLIVTFRGCITTGDPWDVIATDTEGTGSTSVSVPGNTTTGADRLIAAISTHATDTASLQFSGWANADLTSVSDDVDITTGQGNGGGIGVMTGVKAAAGAFGASTATLATSSLQARMSIALKPPASFAGGDDDGVRAPTPGRPIAWAPPLSLSPQADEAGVFANFALELDYDHKPRVTPLRFTPPPVSRAFVYDEIYEIAAFGLEPEYRYMPRPRSLEMQPHTLIHYSDELAIAQPTAPTGTTAAAIAAGNLNYKWVASIEGYQYLLTNATPTQATDAWYGSGFTSALGGLYVRCDLSNEINPWLPFSAPGGSLTLSVAQSTSADTFGVDTAKKTTSSSGTETTITASIDADDGSIPVKFTTSMASSGVAYIGTEAIRYGSKAAAALNSVQRGIYAPFRTANSGVQGFGHAHEVVLDATVQDIALEPVVSSEPRSWIGKWVGLWQHKLDVSTGLINRRDDARCIYAGRIKSIRDNPTTMMTDVECEHLLEWLPRAVVGDKFWSGQLADGVTIVAGQEFRASDTNLTTMAHNAATPLVVVAGTPATTYEVQEGRYTPFDLNSRINQWLAQALFDADLTASMNVGISQVNGVSYGRLKATAPNTTTGVFYRVRLSLPPTVATMLGFETEQPDGNTDNRLIERALAEDTTERFWASQPPNRVVGELADLIGESGEFFDQETSLPAGMVAALSPAAVGDVGLCLIGGTQAVLVKKNGTSLTQCMRFDLATNQPIVPANFRIPFDEPPDATKLQQIFYRVAPLHDQIKNLFYGSGTAGYNHPTYDTFPAPVGLAIPGELLGGNFEASVDALPHADVEFPLIVTKATKLEDLIGSDLKLRFAFLRWKDEGLQFYSWQTPTTGTLLNEANKASPAGNKDEPRSVTEITDEWARNVININFARDFTIDGSDTFNNHVTVIDRVAIDDAGRNKRVETINAINSYSQSFLGGGGGIEVLIPHFKSIVPFFTRPVSQSKRTIAPTLFESLAVGDIVTVTDEFARDPDTGQRGVVARPGVLVSHSYSPGGLEPGIDGRSVAPMHGSVGVMFYDLLNVGPMVPSAQVDDTASNGGLSSFGGVGSSLLTCYAHKHSRPSAALDASNMAAGYVVRITEIDPTDPAAPLTWVRTVLSQTGNTIALTSGLSSPAWDATKKYRVTWATFDAVGGDQQGHTYQADDATAMISTLRVPFQYTANTVIKEPTAEEPGLPNSEDRALELPPNNSYGDTVAFDVGTQGACNRLINGLFDYRTCRSNPILFRTAVEVSGDITHDYKLVMVVPIWLTADGLSNSVKRNLYVAPLWKSLGGASVNGRITLSRSLPKGDELTSVTRFAPYGEATFTTTSTSYTTPTAVAIDIGGNRDSNGAAYLYFEMQVPTAAGSEIAMTYGIGTCYEGPRRYP